MTEAKTTGIIENRPAYGLRKAIEAVKDTVSVEDYLRDQGVELKRNRTRCIVHQGDNPQSFSINPEKQVWHCFKCGEGGDVIDLCRAVEGGDLWEVVVDLAARYGVELPNTRTDTWHHWQGHKSRAREAAKVYVASVYQRRLTRVFAPLVLIGGETPEEALELLEGLAKAVWPEALAMAGRRVSGEE